MFPRISPSDTEDDYTGLQAILHHSWRCLGLLCLLPKDALLGMEQSSAGAEALRTLDQNPEEWMEPFGSSLIPLKRDPIRSDVAVILVPELVLQ